MELEFKLRSSPVQVHVLSIPLIHFSLYIKIRNISEILIQPKSLNSSVSSKHQLGMKEM